MNAVIQSGIILPGLPNELAMQCLLNVHYSTLPTLKQVSKSLCLIVSSPQFFSARKNAGISADFLLTVDSAQGLGHQFLKLYDPRKGLWSNLGSITGAVVNSCLLGFRMASLHSKLFIIGGNKQGRSLRECLPSNDVWAFDVITRKWTQNASMVHQRAHFACAVVGEKVYVAGGSTREHHQRDLAFAEVFDPLVGKWIQLPNMNMCRGICVGTALGGKFYVMGDRPGGQGCSSADVFDPATGKWTLVEGMLRCPRDGATVTLDTGFAVLRDQLFHIDTTGFDPSLRVYDSQKNVWKVEDVNPFAGSIRRFTLHSLNNKLHAVGGAYVGANIFSHMRLLIKDFKQSQEPYLHLYIPASEDTNRNKSAWVSVHPVEQSFPGRSVWACTTVTL